MVSFENDYNCGAHPLILARLAQTNLDPQPGYGTDVYCANAIDQIRDACQTPEADVYFVSGGTMANALTLSSILAPYEGVIAADTGHIATHESGAVEYTGHKVITLPHEEGKIKAADLSSYLSSFFADRNHEHMVIPGAVYLSYPTEYGTLYTKDELHEIIMCAHDFGLRVFIDGARLGYGLASPNADLTLPELAFMVDCFTIGGTKVGAILGEAIVFPNGPAPAHFVNLIKKHGALLAKGRLVGIQFETLFSNDLYFSISAHAIDMAMQMKEIFSQHGISLFIDSPTNQQFVILAKETIAALKEQVVFGWWEEYNDTHDVVRFATSWATTEDDLAALSEALLAIDR